MPLIQIRLLEGALSKEQKKEMIARVSEVAAEIEARPHPKAKLLPYTWCVIEEVNPANWGVGGQPTSLEELKAILKA